MASIVTYNFPGDYLTDNIEASVISANADATTLWLQCPTSGAECKNVAMTVTVGPWATVSPHCEIPRTGTVDLYQYISVQDYNAPTTSTTVTYSLHCGVTDGTVLDECTYASTVGGHAKSVTLQHPLLQVYQQPLTITAGFDKLESATSSCPASTTVLSSNTLEEGLATVDHTTVQNVTYTTTAGGTLTSTAESEVTSVQTSVVTEAAISEVSTTAVEVTTVVGSTGVGTARPSSGAAVRSGMRARNVWLLVVVFGIFSR